MKQIKFLSKLILVSLFAVAFVACDKDDEDDAMVTNNQTQNQKSIVEIAQSDAQFSILVDALIKADLVSALQGDGPFTVFAPTNDAFNQLFTDLKVTGLNDLTADDLKPILLYHVVASKAVSGDLTNGYISTMNMDMSKKNYTSLQVNTDMGVKLNNMVSVTSADIMATNGVIHVIDKVLLPPSVVDIASQNSDFSILVDALVKADLVTALQGNGPFTVFAPTNAAFNQLFMDLKVNGLDDLTKQDLEPILLYHVVSGNVLSTDLSSGSVPTLNTNASIDVAVGANVMLDNASKVVLTDVQGTNGVVHVIDKVLVP